MNKKYKLIERGDEVIIKSNKFNCEFMERRAIVLNVKNIGISRSFELYILNTDMDTIWLDESEVEFVCKGKQSSITKYENNIRTYEEKLCDLNFIKEEFIKNKGNIHHISILYLFNRIGFDSKYYKSKNFFDLAEEWNKINYVFTLLFNKQKDLMIAKIHFTFTNNYIDYYIKKFSELYDEINK